MLKTKTIFCMLFFIFIGSGFIFSQQTANAKFALVIVIEFNKLAIEYDKNNPV